MVKQISVTLLALLSVSLPRNVNSMEICQQIEPQANFSLKEYTDIDTISDLAIKAAKLVKKGIFPSEITVIFDVDGTLTKHGTPDGDYNEDTEICP
ncbi:hypothetical protein [Candidatus Odyssella acanthamoebae]|uniref:Uncharacterized protein n=1 Tax=Candidatus Odyssella acanthamoebae TaxID=91604 RepID=A0A077B0L0_9PROT|nr:hypothetical protein [Candidatus Paracaedibacter acanthamoebae]AIK96455.1 hypothetical protein ID47_06425 [Candidatus Paracaedibacter acanthamoebae]